jgi:hypothetical protein
MPARQKITKGISTRVFLGALTSLQILADPFVAPSKTAVTFTITGAVASGATAVTVPALTVAIPAGGVIEVTAAGIAYVLLVTTEALVGATSLTIAANGRAIPAGGAASFSPLYRLQGGTNSDVQSAGAVSSQVIYEDPALNVGGWTASDTISQSWTATYNGVVFSASGTYALLSYMAVNKAAPYYFRREIQPAAGYVTGPSKSGLVTLSQYSEPADAAAYVTMQCSFTGDLALEIGQAV